MNKLKKKKKISIIQIKSIFMNNDCISYANSNLEEGVAQLFKELSDASRSNQIAVIDALINQAKSSNYFNEN